MGPIASINRILLQGASQRSWNILSRECILSSRMFWELVIPEEWDAPAPERMGGHGIFGLHMVTGQHSHQLEPTIGSPSAGCSEDIPTIQSMRANVIDRSTNDYLNKVHPGCPAQSAHVQHESPPGPVDVIQAQSSSPQEVRMLCPFIVEHAE